MDVDARRDHSLRIPRPDLSVQFGTPNACTGCHLDLQDKSAAFPNREELPRYQDWMAAARTGDQQVREALAQIDRQMAAAVAKWYPPDRERRDAHFATTLAAAHSNDPSAEKPLADMVGNGRLPAIVRATALMELGRYGGEPSVEASKRALSDNDPQVRAAAAANLHGRPPRELIRLLVPMLSDPVRLVRVEAARVLASVPAAEMRGRDRDALHAAVAELELSLAIDGDRAGSHASMGVVYENLGEDAKAIAAYQTAMRVEPAVTGPRTNLAALYDRQADEAEQAARQAAQRRDETAGLRAVEQAMSKRELAAALRRDELDLLARDVRLLPENSALQYRYGMALYLQRRLADAEAALRAAHRLDPNDPQYLLGLVLFCKEVDRIDEAAVLAAELVKLRPDDAMFRQVLHEIRQQQSGKPASVPQHPGD
jgi:tetratricopeptide (TPR) repeat protein